MALTAPQRQAIEKVIEALLAVSAGGRGKRMLADMFLDLPDTEAWSEYYEVISQPRCINGVKEKVAKHDRTGYKDTLDVYDDLNLVFLNALYYNEDGSQITKDATTLKNALAAEWKKHPELPTPRSSDPPDSLRKEKNPRKPAASAVATPIKSAANIRASTPRTGKLTPVPAAPSAASTPQPTALPPPSSAQDMDVDIEGMGNGSDNEGEGEVSSYGYGFSGPAFLEKESLARDVESDAIVRQLERGLPRWEGYGDKGWMEGVSLERCAEIVHAIKAHKDIVNNTRVASALDSIPEDANIKTLSFNYPLSLKIIESKARAKEYASSVEFDKDMIRLFEKGRRWYDICSEQYGDITLLQRLYQALTSPTPPAGPPYTSTTHFSSIRAGPGTARPVHGSSASDAELVSGVTTFRISSKDRHFVDEVHYKGWSVRLADWLHLANPDDPNRPIVAQVFKCWVSDEPSKKGKPGITACWYYRPEQTFHPANREFWEGEVFKTGHFADHPLEDILEKIACQFTARHLRGRPRPPFWYPGWPLYVCDSRYNDRERVFVRIKNWASCVPEEVRKKPAWMPIYEFERTVVPRRVGSPFAPAGMGVGGGAKGRKGGRLPGGIGDAVERADGEKIEGGGTGRKRPKKSGSGLGVGGQSLGPGPASAAPGPGPSRLAQAQAMAVGQAASSSPYTGAGTGAAAYLTAYGAASVVRPPTASGVGGVGTAGTPRPERSVIAMAGGPAVLASANVEKLSAETARYFDRDPETNEVLWFPGPPVDIAHPQGPRHSLAYLHFLATKRKRRQEGADSEMGDDNVFGGTRASGDKGQDGTGKNGKEKEEEVGGGEAHGGVKRVRTAQVAPPLASDILGKLLSSVEVS